MRPRNLGATSLKRRSRHADPMRAYDRLPPELRGWLSAAALPWSPASARRAYAAALARTNDPAHALAQLDRLQHRLIARDAPRIWGPHHPDAAKDRLTAPQVSATESRPAVTRA